MKGTAMKQCRDVYVLADGSKFGQVSSVTFGEFRDAQILTEAIPEEYQESKNISKVDGVYVWSQAYGSWLLFVWWKRDA